MTTPPVADHCAIRSLRFDFRNSQLCGDCIEDGDVILDKPYFLSPMYSVPLQAPSAPTCRLAEAETGYFVK